MFVVAAGLVAWLGTEAHTIYFGRNWHEVIPGRIFRCAQLSAKDLAEQIDRYGIRTVVNLRGACIGFKWYEAECRATSTHGVSQEDVTLSATRLPAPDEVRRFVDVLERTEYPIALHCRQGVDRTGMMSAAALLLLTETTPDQARRQLGLRFGHVPFGPTRVMNRFLELYDEWRSVKRVEHSREAFRRWAYSEYCPDQCRGSLTLLDSPTCVTAGAPLALRVRATNESVSEWRLHAGTETGVHVRFMVFAADGKLIQVGRAGQFERQVAPRESLEVTLAVAPLHQSGRYQLLADLQDRNLWAFSQFGCDPIEISFEVVAP
jgi:protein tyrosine phosphatase (PTP) superfamily phosphohydrolase (DUF442 family)